MLQSFLRPLRAHIFQKASQFKPNAFVGCISRLIHNAAPPDHTTALPVIIVGAGPSGLTLSIHLSRYGIPHAVLDQADGPTQHPQAHFINNRTMEVRARVQSAQACGAVLKAATEKRLLAWTDWVLCASAKMERMGKESVYQVLSNGSVHDSIAKGEQVTAGAGGLLKQKHASHDKLQAPTSSLQVITPPLMLQVFQPLSGLAREILQRSPPLAEWRKFVYCDSLAANATVYGEVDHFEGSETGLQAEVSPLPVAHLSQNRLLPLLLERAQAGGFGSVQYGSRVVRTSQDASGVDVHISASASSSPHKRQQRDSSAFPLSTYVMRGSYLIAADGAGSGIRAACGIGMSGQPNLQHLINIHFFSPTLAALAMTRPAMLYFVFSPKVVGVLVAHDLSTGEFVAQVPFFPPLQSVADFGPAVCIDLIESAAGQALGDVSLRQVRPWVMSAEVADRFRDARILLMGDAAHRFPPAGGFGMNTGVQDAHNLAWKLACVIKGAAGEKLLDSYESERRPVALSNTALSVVNWEEAMRVPKAMGLDPRAANLLSTAAAAVPLPDSIKKGLLEAGLAFGKSIAGTQGPLGSSRKQALASIFAGGNTLRLQFPAEDLGFRYAAPLDPSRRSVPVAGGPDKTRGAPYVPSTEPGGRMPHCWLELPMLRTEGALHFTPKGEVQQQPQQVSSHVSLFPPSFMRDALLRDMSHLDTKSADVSGANHSRSSGSSNGRGVHVGGNVRISTLQLPAACAPHLLLLVDSEGGSENVWLQAVTDIRARALHVKTGQASDRQLIPPARWVSVVQVSQPSSAIVKPCSMPSESAGESTDESCAESLTGGTDAAGQLVVVDAGRTWHASMGLTVGSALLVRPDGHIAWRHMGHAGSLPAASDKLAQALQSALSS